MFVYEIIELNDILYYIGKFNDEIEVKRIEYSEKVLYFIKLL